MSEQEQEQTEQGGGAAGGTAVKALAAAAATGAATYAVRKALASRNGHSEEEEGDEVRSEPEGSAEDDEDGDDSREDDEGEYEPEGSADEQDENDEDDEREEPAVNGSDRSRGKGSLRQLINPSMQLLLPLAEEAADSAGRYVAEHAPDAVRDRVVPRFIDAFDKAS